MLERHLREEALSRAGLNLIIIPFQLYRDFVTSKEIKHIKEIGRGRLPDALSSSQFQVSNMNEAG